METQAVCKGPNTEIVRDFQEMLSSLTTQPCFTGLVGGLNEATKLRKQVEKLNERVRTTESKYESDKETMHTTHESSMKKFLQVHCNEIAQKTKEIDSLKEETSTLGRQLENERESGRTNTDQINKLEQSVARMIKQQKTDEEKLLQAEAKRHKLMEQLQRKSDEVITAQKDMEAVKKQLFQLHKSYTDLDAAKVSTEARLQAATRSLDNVKAYTSVIHQEAPRTEVFETLARSFYDVVGAAFQEDIAENVIRVSFLPLLLMDQKPSCC
jgi:chromosome segregation ATPase